MISDKFKNVLFANTNKVKFAGFYFDTILVVDELVLVNTKQDIKNMSMAKNIANDEIVNNIGDVVGYVIKNVGSFTIKNIQVPVYSYNATKKKYEGTIKDIDLKPGEAIDLPTKWLMLLLSRLEYMSLVKNGEFISRSRKQNSLDEYFNSFKFSKELYPIVVGAYNINTHRATIFKEYKEMFGYMENCSKLVDVKMNDNTAIFLGLMLRKD